MTASDEIPSSPPSGSKQVILHATTVANDDAALLILGPSGSGKSALALDLIAIGATLVSDDRTIVRRDGPRLLAAPPPTIAGRIEARHIGILQVPNVSDIEVQMALDLSHEEHHRLPPSRTIDLLGQTITLLYRPPGGHFASALLQCLMQRRKNP